MLSDVIEVVLCTHCGSLAGTATQGNAAHMEGISRMKGITQMLVITGGGTVCYTEYRIN